MWDTEQHPASWRAWVYSAKEPGDRPDQGERCTTGRRSLRNTTTPMQWSQERRRRDWSRTPAMDSLAEPVLLGPLGKRYNVVLDHGAQAGRRGRRCGAVRYGHHAGSASGACRPSPMARWTSSFERMEDDTSLAGISSGVLLRPLVLRHSLSLDGYAAPPTSVPDDSFLEYDEDQEFVAYMPEVADLKAQDGGPILAHSGVRLAQALVRADLTYS